MKRFGAGLVSVWIIAFASIAASEIWESKPFNTWTAKELQDVLTDSPWAGKASIKYVQNRSNQPSIQEAALVTWASAPVMRQARLRQEYGATAEVTAQEQTLLARPSPYYVVTVTISNGVNSASHADRAMEMLDETFLLVRGQAPIPATDAEGQVLDTSSQTPGAAGAAAGGRNAIGMRPAFSAAPDQRGGGGGGAGGGVGGGGQRGGSIGRGSGPRGRGRGGVNEAPTTASVILFRFPRDPITLEDKEVDFVTKLCGSNGVGRGDAVPPPPENNQLFDLGAAAQRGGGGGGGGFGGGGRRGATGINTGRMGAANLPSCNYDVKKTFKLKNMVVKGQLAL
jgi:hypothetical protein